MWHIDALIVLILFMAVTVGTIGFWLIASVIGAYYGDSRPMFFPSRIPFGIAFGIAVVLFFFALRALRRTAAPVGDLLEAAGQVQTGDYTVWVKERGTREVRALVRAFNAMVTRLQANERQRRDLLADVTHELRTPLTVIQGNLEGLLDGIYPRDDAHLSMILDETRVFSRLVEDLRTLAQAESGTLKLQRELTDLGILIAETVASFAAQADEAGVTLSTDVHPDVPALSVDPVRIRAVIANLLINALRYTPAGGKIVVGAELEGTRQRVAIIVTDTGQGISADLLPHIFDRFYKSSDSRGSGLGLAIAKYIVTAHGGDISAASEPGKGTTIRFTLPIEAWSEAGFTCPTPLAVIQFAEILRQEFLARFDTSVTLWRLWFSYDPYTYTW
jgi:signal transduction histidine kinase